MTLGRSMPAAMVVQLVNSNSQITVATYCIFNTVTLRAIGYWIWGDLQLELRRPGPLSSIHHLRKSILRVC